MSSPLDEGQIAARHDRGSQGFTPPAWRNHPNATGEDTPASPAASSVVTPRAIAAQNLTRSSHHATVGRPGEGTRPDTTGPPAAAPASSPTDTSVIEVLRRPIESTLATTISMHPGTSNPDAALALVDVASGDTTVVAGSTFGVGEPYGYVAWSPMAARSSLPAITAFGPSSFAAANSPTWASPAPTTQSASCPDWIADTNARTPLTPGSSVRPPASGVAMDCHGRAQRPLAQPRPPSTRRASTTTHERRTCGPSPAAPGDRGRTAASRSFPRRSTPRCSNSARRRNAPGHPRSGTVSR
jgi:hypothetical protein